MMRAGKIIGRCTGAVFAMVIITAVLASCQNIFTDEPLAAQTTLNTYQVTVTGTSPTGLTTGTITASFDNLTSSTTLDSAVALPWSFTTTATTADFTAPAVFNATVAVNGATQNESVRLVVIYQEFGPGDPVTHTLFDQTVSSPVNGDISVSYNFVLPYENLD